MMIQKNGLIVAINYNAKKVIDSLMISGKSRPMTAPKIGAYMVEAWPEKEGATGAGGWLYCVAAYFTAGEAYRAARQIVEAGLD